MRRKVILLLPLTFNDGTTVPQMTLDTIYDEFFLHYGGYTLAGTVQGAYRMQSGDRQVDHCQEVWVAVEEADLNDLRQRVSKYCGMLGQEVMCFEVTDAAVEFIGPPDQEEQSHDQGS